MGEIQTKGCIENLNLLFSDFDTISYMELIPDVYCFVQYKPGKMNTFVKIKTTNDKVITIPFTELSSLEVSDGKTTIEGTNYDIYS